LHLWTQVVGKVRFSESPWINHSWGVTLYVTSRGLTTSPIPNGARTFQIDFDLVDHALSIVMSDGRKTGFPLRPRSVADFYRNLMQELGTLGIHPEFSPMPNEVPYPTRFDLDEANKAYDAEHANRYWRALVRVDSVFNEFRARFTGKCSPVHYFWGTRDLSVTRFSGRPAPVHPGGVPYLPDWVSRDAYSQELSSCGFLPGGGPIPYPAFYSYAYPEPVGFEKADVAPDQAYYLQDLHQFVLPYDAVRLSSAPEDTLLEFLQSAYEAAADLAKWDRPLLDYQSVRRGRIRARSGARGASGTPRARQEARRSSAAGRRPRRRDEDMVITVTGATGLIGSELVRLLSEAEHATRAVSRSAGRIASRPGVAWVLADLGDPRMLEPVLAGTSRLFLLTDNQPGFGDLQVKIIRLARELGVEHIVKLSALGASDHSRSWIGREHWQVEQALFESPESLLRWTILRPHAFMQNWLGEVAETVRADGTIYSAIEGGKVPFIDARDIAAVAAEVLRHPEGHVNAKRVLTGGEAVGFAQLAEALSDATGKRIRYQPISMEEAGQRMRAHGANEESIEAMLALATYQRAGGATAQVSEHVQQILGRPPRGIRDFARDYSAQFKGD
jgi:uncharacterized protein YbjT (DUF2867 family)